MNQKRVMLVIWKYVSMWALHTIASESWSLSMGSTLFFHRVCNPLCKSVLYFFYFFIFSLDRFAFFLNIYNVKLNNKLSLCRRQYRSETSYLFFYVPYNSLRCSLCILHFTTTTIFSKCPHCKFKPQTMGKEFLI